MSQSRDTLEDAGALLLGFLVLKVVGSWGWWRSDPWWEPEYTDKGGRGAGPGATTAPVPQGGANVWSEETMRIFARSMGLVPIDPMLVLKGIAAASRFNADATMGDNVGLLLVRRADLAQVGVGIPETFEGLSAPEQIPWIARVIAYRIADTGGRAPETIGDLALLLHPASNPNIADVIRKEAERRGKDAEGTSLFIHHANLLRRVRANP